jgi:hypothetical protein
MRNYPSTARQIAAARANGARGLGPLTPQTRAKSALNARTHGLCAKTVLLPGESSDRLQELYDDLHDEFQPQTTSEFLLLEDLAASAWRQLRARGLEKDLLAHEIEENGAPNLREAWLRSEHARRLHRYESTHRRAFKAARRDLLEAALLRLLAAGPPPAANGENQELRIEPNTPQKEEN